MEVLNTEELMKLTLEAMERIKTLLDHKGEYADREQHLVQIAFDSLGMFGKWVLTEEAAAQAAELARGRKAGPKGKKQIMKINKRHLESMGYHVRINEGAGIVEITTDLQYDPAPLEDAISEFVDSPEYAEALTTQLVTKINGIRLMEAFGESEKKDRLEEAAHRNRRNQNKKNDDLARPLK